MSKDFTDMTQSLVNEFFQWHVIGIVVLMIGIGLSLMWLVTRFANWMLKRAIEQTDKINDADKKMRHLRAETIINVAAAVVKISIFISMFLVTWKLLIPSSAPIAVVGASAFVVVLSGATVAPLLRDITSGSIMLAERWYGVGDYLMVEPLKVQGVVEQVSLRSTKLRGLSGEVVWVHNQHIQGVRVKYRGVSTIALDVFVKDKAKALELLHGIVDIVPKGPMLVLDGLQITEVESINKTMWRIELMGQTVPGREWLIEKFTTEAIKDADDQHDSAKKIIAYGPISRYVDATAERRFKRAIRQAAQSKRKVKPAIKTTHKSSN